MSIVHGRELTVAQPLRRQRHFFPLYGTAITAASLTRRDILDTIAARSRSEIVILDSKLWSYTNGLLVARMTFGFRWTVTAGNSWTRVTWATPASLPSIALLPRGLGPRMACAEPARMFRSWLYFAASASCQGGQRRGQTRPILPVPVDCGQHEMKGNMQTYSKARTGYPRIACLLEPSE